MKTNKHPGESRCRVHGNTVGRACQTRTDWCQTWQDQSVFEALTVAALSLAYSHNIVTDSISSEHILAGLTSLSLSAAKVHAVHFKSRYKFKILRIGSGVGERLRDFNPFLSSWV